MYRSSVSPLQDSTVGAISAHARSPLRRCWSACRRVPLKHVISWLDADHYARDALVVRAGATVHLDRDEREAK
jgi:hypothetical protein